MALRYNSPSSSRLVFCWLFAACNPAWVGPSQPGDGNRAPGGDLAASGGDERILAADTALPAGDAASQPGDAAIAVGDPEQQAQPLGTLSGVLRVDHIGWRPADRKVGVLLGNPGVTVELRRVGDNAAVGQYTASSTKNDEDSGDSYATVDFSAFTAAGEYYLFLPTAKLRSYPFRIAPDVYDIIGEAAAKSFYFQRCNHARAQPYATDVLGGFPGSGGRWLDGACHLTDKSAPAGPGSTDHGALDVSGGWHDAGDYQKTLWGRGVPELLFAYEQNPNVWRDGQLNIPESQNGIPDLLDEIAWELEFYLRMQRPDGHFMSSVKGNNPTVASPPSASDEHRVYFDCTSPSGNGWSGGGVTLTTATGNAVLSLAHAALVWRTIGQTATADRYAAAARLGWTWLSGQTPSAAGERRIKVAAASALFRLDATQTTAKAFVEGFAWGTWDGMLSGSATPAENTLANGAWHYLLNTNGTSAHKDTIREAARRALVETAFAQEGAYGGMFGGPGNGWDYCWGSNRNQGQYGANLMMAARLGVLGGRTAAELRARAEKHVHYLLGLNPLNMLYFTNMAAYGGEHSSFQIYHAWFSYTGNDGDHGNATYNGKPSSTAEPQYPYFADDNATSTYGPPPGIVPGGPNFYYSGSYTIPNRDRPAYAYRDFSVGCEWDGAACRAAAWEITEPMAAYQGPVVLLLSFMMSDS
jgi:hypothetical protein